MKTEAKLDVISDVEVAITRSFDAPRELMFDVWTKPEHLTNWLVQPGWTFDVCDIDLRVGGAIQYVWGRPDGTKMTITGEFREISRPDRLVATDCWEGWPETINTVTFVETSGQTTVTVSIRYPSIEARDAALKTPMLEGMNTGYAQLDAYLAPRDLVIKRRFAVPVEKVWHAWSDSDEVRKWWGPTGFTCPSAVMDFREGGASLVCMRAPAEFGGQDYYSTWTYQAIKPHETIEFVHGFADATGAETGPDSVGAPAGVPARTPHLLRFDRIAENETELTVTEYGYRSGFALEMSKAGMEQCLDKMATSFER